MDQRADSARYDAAAQRVLLELRTGYLFGIPLERLPEVKNAAPEDLATVEIIGAGGILHWESLDADYSVPALVVDGIGASAAARELAARGGRVRSREKAAAARANGKKGGRPRKPRSTKR